MRNERFVYMDILNTIAIFGVIILHCSELGFNTFQPSNLRWLIAISFQIIFIFAVPAFFMLSGANLLDYRDRYTTSIFFKKRLSKVLTPFIFWSAIWYFFDNPSQKQESISLFLKNIIYGKIEPFFWFFYIIIGFYLVVPFLSLMAKEENKKTIMALILSFIIIDGIIIYGCNLSNIAVPSIITSIPLFTSGYLIFFLSGWYIHNMNFSRNYNKYFIFAGLIGLIGMFVLTYLISAKVGRTNRLGYSFVGIFGMIYCLSLFTVFKSQLKDIKLNKKITKFFKATSSTSLGIYCIHVYFIRLFDQLFNLTSGSYYHLFILPFLVYCLSFLIVYILKKIPLVKLIFP